MAVLARSHDIWGPYESCPCNPILTNRNDTSKQALCCGHADLVADGHGCLWLVHLGTRPSTGFLSHLGRETFLTPAELSDGWIRVSGEGRARISAGGPTEAKQVLLNGLDFDFGTRGWEKPWLFLRQPDMGNYRRADGCLLLRPTTIKLTDKTGSPTFAAVRQMDFDCVTEISFMLDTEQTGDEAGAAVYLTPDFMYRIFKRREETGDYIIVLKIADDFVQTAYRQRIGEGVVHVRIRADKLHYEFHYAVDGGDMHCACRASTRFLACELAGRCYTGAVTGIYAQAEKHTGSVAKYYRFRQTASRDMAWPKWP